MKRIAPYIVDALIVLIIMGTVIQIVRYAATCRQITQQQKAAK